MQRAGNIEIAYAEIDAGAVLLHFDLPNRPGGSVNGARQSLRRLIRVGGPRADGARGMTVWEQRAATRIDTEVKIDLPQSRDGASTVTRNISCGGLFVATPRPARVGRRLEVRFMLPGEQRPLAVIAEVRWVGASGGSPGMGLKFIGLGAAAETTIASFIQRQQGCAP